MKKHLSLFSIVCLVLCGPFTLAQEIVSYPAKKNQFRVAAGVDYFKTRDLQFSPNVYRGILSNLNLGYVRQSTEGMLDTHLNVFMGNLTPETPTGKVAIVETDFYGVQSTEQFKLMHLQMGVDLDLGYLRSIAFLSTARMKVLMGGSVREHLTYSPGMFNLGTINYVSLNAKAGMDYILKNKRKLSGEISFPVLSVVTRLPYHNAPGAPGQSPLRTFFTGSNKTETVNHFQAINLSLKYPLLIRRKLTVDVTYHVYWLHYYEPDHLTIAGSQLSLGVNF